MPSYKAPLRDMRFLLNEVFDFPAHYRALANGSDATPDMVEAILDECARLCEEVFGGHGYIREHGMEQIVRDARIATLYEGTTGIRALDLLGRKVLLMTQGKAVRDFTGQIARLAVDLLRNAPARSATW